MPASSRGFGSKVFGKVSFVRCFLNNLRNKKLVCEILVTFRKVKRFFVPFVRPKKRSKKRHPFGVSFLWLWTIMDSNH